MNNIYCVELVCNGNVSWLSYYDSEDNAYTTRDRLEGLPFVKIVRVYDCQVSDEILETLEIKKFAYGEEESEDNE